MTAALTFLFCFAAVPALLSRPCPGYAGRMRKNLRRGVIATKAGVWSPGEPG